MKWKNICHLLRSKGSYVKIEIELNEENDLCRFNVTLCTGEVNYCAKICVEIVEN